MFYLTFLGFIISVLSLQDLDKNKVLVPLIDQKKSLFDNGQSLQFSWGTYPIQIRKEGSRYSIYTNKSRRVCESKSELVICSNKKGENNTFHIKLFEPKGSSESSSSEAKDEKAVYSIRRHRGSWFKRQESCLNSALKFEKCEKKTRQAFYLKRYAQNESSRSKVPVNYYPSLTDRPPAIINKNGAAEKKLQDLNNRLEKNVYKIERMKSWVDDPLKNRKIPGNIVLGPDHCFNINPGYNQNNNYPNKYLDNKDKENFYRNREDIEFCKSGCDMVYAFNKRTGDFEETGYNTLTLKNVAKEAYGPNENGILSQLRPFLSLNPDLNDCRNLKDDYRNFLETRFMNFEPCYNDFITMGISPVDIYSKNFSDYDYDRRPYMNDNSRRNHNNFNAPNSDEDYFSRSNLNKCFPDSEDPMKRKLREYAEYIFENKESDSDRIIRQGLEDAELRDLYRNNLRKIGTYSC